MSKIIKIIVLFCSVIPSFLFSGYSITDMYNNKEDLIKSIGIDEFLNLLTNTPIQSEVYEIFGYKFEWGYEQIYKEELINRFTPDELLKYVISKKPKISKEHLELARKAIDRGMSLENYKIMPHDFPNDSNNNELFELLEILVKNGAPCTAEKDTDYEHIQLILESGIDIELIDPKFFLFQRFKNINAKEAIEPKMPYIVHHIWLTHPSSPREVRDEDIANVVATKELFAKGEAQWEHIVWMNNPKLIPDSVSKLEEAGIEVKSIYDYKDELKIFWLIEKLIDEKDWGKASDALRYVLVEHFGGVYADLNFIFERDVMAEVHKYNFFIPSESQLTLVMENNFFGSSAKHPILERVIELVQRNLTTPPAYIGDIINHWGWRNSMVTDFGTAYVLYAAYYTHANTEGNIDIAYPHKYARDFSDDLRPGYSKLKRICPLLGAIQDLKIYLRNSSPSAPKGLTTIGRDGPKGKTWVNN